MTLTDQMRQVGRFDMSYTLPKPGLGVNRISMKHSTHATRCLVASILSKKRRS